MDPRHTSSTPSIPDFFANREIFITGGTGFIGKALIEKLLRSCPDIKAIYMLMRPKKGQQIGDRLKSICDLVLFDLLRQKNPKFMDKLIPIAGDVAERGLGISDEDRARLRNVSVVFHSAANTQFDNPLKKAILLNTRGTFGLLKFCESLSSLMVVLHVSTGYSNPHVPVIGEQIYPALADWRVIIDLCETNAHDELLDALGAKLTENAANTYLLSKHLSEQVVQFFSQRLPIAVVRPTIVFNVMDEPLPGYMENLNTLAASCMGVGTGVLKVMYADPKNVMDGIPVDACVKGIIIAAWKRALEPQSKLSVYNAAFSSIKFNTPLEDVMETVQTELLEEFPYGDNVMLPPSYHLSLNKKLVICYSWIFQLLPALILDGIFKILNKKTGLLKLQRKISSWSMTVTYFVRRDWSFSAENFYGLNSCLKMGDLEAFDFQKYENFDPKAFLRTSVYGTRKYLMNLKDEDLERDIKKFKRIKKIGLFAKTLFGIFVGWFLVVNFYNF